MFRPCALSVLALLTLAPSAGYDGSADFQPRGVRELVSELGAADPSARARAACGLRELGDNAAEAIQPLVTMLGDAAPVESAVCSRRWWRGNANDLTSPGEQAAAALVAIGSRVFQPVLATLRAVSWAARRNAAWALGALDDQRAVSGLVDALKDREAAVREQVAWALGAIDDNTAVPALVRALGDGAAPVRQQSAWALGAIDDPRAVDGLVHALADASSGVREQAAWALGAIGDRRALPGLLPSLKDADASVRKQAAWAIGVIGK
ncbi:MAG: HEAT repeat domain-containing protein [Acidobacteriota bacterium]